ncbi:hypothetical protein CVU82_04320 [Candidatus Falkowbacteria bacterium HGW-Falkowbacteria-1]|jgi:hypothetical protein|uniref:Uncharacterized protein n=1 Tax=Candidatus Falkowbacteria bacterium HGW-Falkowbacteria-1 TaxID=2013768 RepID=A0A2N2E8N6_9BACT|nr:MAG: hypothetical protein CVU82_04320 [Candidatus Falkowbacteria bacterium HGW-Falkowbacteria-1]
MEKIENSLEYWSHFYEKYFSIKTDFANKLIHCNIFNGAVSSMFDKDKHYLFFIPRQLDIEQVFSKINASLGINFPESFFDFNEVINIRDGKEDYFMVVSQKPFVELPFGSTVDFNVKEQLTLLEALILVLYCIDIKKNLNFLEYVLCGASKIEKGRSVYMPAVHYDKQRNDVSVVCYDSFYAVKNLNKLMGLQLEIS